MRKKLLPLLLSFILFTYYLIFCTSVVSSSPCSVCGDTALECYLSMGWQDGVAQSDEEWYWFNCGENSYNQLEIRATAGGEYSLCKIENQEPGQCPTSDDVCVTEGEGLEFYQGLDDTYWVLARRISGDTGFQIHLHCLGGLPPVSTTTIPSTPSTFSGNYSSKLWLIILVVIIAAAVISYKFMSKK